MAEKFFQALSEATEWVRRQDEVDETRCRIEELECENDVLRGEVSYWKGEAEKARQELATAKAVGVSRGW